MTVCIGVAVNDCLVFAADSASTLVTTNPATGASQVLNVYRHGNKVFNVCKGLPVVAMTAGMGNIGNESIATLVKDLRQRLKAGVADWIIDSSNYTVADIAHKARRLIFEERFQSLSPVPAAPHSFEFWIGGYDAERKNGHSVWKIEIVNGQCSVPVNLLSDGATSILVGGQSAPVERLVSGVDSRAVEVLIRGGVSPEPAKNALTQLRKELESQLLAPTMPVQDAIELADFLVDVTKRYYRFLPGADLVGGDTDIAVVTRYEGFKWVRRKHYYPEHLNRLETDHV